MTIDDGLERENSNMISTGRKEKYLRYHQAKLLNINILYDIDNGILPLYDQSPIKE